MQQPVGANLQVRTGRISGQKVALQGAQFVVLNGLPQALGVDVPK
jgi:hypothetical protein